MPVDLKKIPSTPGIYKFYNNSKIIYIGKAKNLKKRVSSYFGKSKKDRKTRQIKKLTDDIETFSTKNEVEALLLEQLLIKENKPKFNILLRDDKTYPYIFFSDSHDYPFIALKRTKKAVDKRYYGPFISSTAVKQSIKDIQKIFKIRNCTDITFASRTRPCIEYQMKRCSAPCVGNITKSHYEEDLIQAKNYLSSSSSQINKKLKGEMKFHVKNLDFEKAAIIRDKLKRINIIQQEQSITTKGKDLDIFSVSEDSGYIGICTVVVRNGKIRGTKTNIVKRGYFQSICNIYEIALINFYNINQDIPKKILTAHHVSSKEVISKAIFEKTNILPKIITTPSKDIKPIYDLCKTNSNQVIVNHLSNEEKYSNAFKDLNEHLGIKKIKRIEAFDISHLYQNHGVAGCVVYTNEGPLKTKYRLYSIPKPITGDDLGSIRHALARRLKYYADNSTKPDLLLIDGGKNQLKAAESIIKKSDHKDIMVISIVKGAQRLRATETILSTKGVIQMNKYSKGYLLLQEIRDESHRFAIIAQRKKKKNNLKKSFLDKIPGIGPVIKSNLMKKYKNIQNIKTAKLNDLMTVRGINEKIGKEIIARSINHETNY